MNTANRITLARIGLIPVFLFFLLTRFVPGSVFIALGVFLLASLSDGLDGYIARKYNLITDFGKFIDPLADKLLICAALAGLQHWGFVSSVLVFAVVARELVVTALRAEAVRTGTVIAAAFSGKLKMVTQIVAVSIGLLAVEYAECALWLKTASDIGMWIMGSVTVYSGVEYLVKNRSAVDFRK